MKLYLQFGYGMMRLSEELLTAWGDAGVILSPRDLTEDQLVRAAHSARGAKAEPMLDPQCYLHDADHHRLTGHYYWQKYQESTTTSLLSGQGAKGVLQALGHLDRRLGLQRHILPGLVAHPVDEHWLNLHEQLVLAGMKEFADEAVLATVALSADALCDEDQIEAVIERAADWPVDGFYVVAETPHAYLVEDPVWLSNILILASGLKLLGKTVIVGYANHQLLALAAANVDAMASGTWLNVRAFSPSKFYMPGEDDVSRRTVWYYCPQALTEYQIQFLDIALRNGVLDTMATDPALGSSYSVPLFAGPPPSSVRWREPTPFYHYLTSLHSQCTAVTSSSFDEALKRQTLLLDTAERINKSLRSNGVFARQRDFAPIFDVNRSALITLKQARGARLTREW